MMTLIAVMSVHRVTIVLPLVAGMIYILNAVDLFDDGLPLSYQGKYLSTSDSGSFVTYIHDN